MLDLDALCRKTVDVRFGGQVYRVLTPTVGTVRRLLALESCPDEELPERQLQLAEELLARNADGLPVGREALERLSPAALNALLSEVIRLASEVSHEPD